MTSAPHVTSSILKAAEECSFETERAAERSDGLWTPGRHDDPKCRLGLRVIMHQAVAKAISTSAVCEVPPPARQELDHDHCKQACVSCGRVACSASVSETAHGAFLVGRHHSCWIKPRRRFLRHIERFVLTMLSPSTPRVLDEGARLKLQQASPSYDTAAPLR